MDWRKIKQTEKDSICEFPDNWLFLHYFEAFNMLFKLENALRVFVYIILKENFKHKWLETNLISDDSSQGTIISISKGRKAQLERQSYLGYVIDNPMVYLTTGELIGIILAEAYRPIFKGYFKGNKTMIEYKLSEISLFRNSLAHFRPIKNEDIDYYKHIIQQLFDGINILIHETLNCDLILPENYNKSRYKELKTLDTKDIKIDSSSSESCNWIELSLIYKEPTVKKRLLFNDYFKYTTININTAKLCDKFKELCKEVIYIKESFSYPTFNNETLQIEKKIKLVMSNKTLENNSENIIKNIQDIINLISAEELAIAENPNIIGEIMELGTVIIYKEKDKKHFNFDYENLISKIANCSQLEYWGNYTVYDKDYIANADYYPWIDIKTAFEPLPF